MKSIITLIALVASITAHAQTTTCRPDRFGGFVCETSQPVTCTPNQYINADCSVRTR